MAFWISSNCSGVTAACAGCSIPDVSLNVGPCCLATDGSSESAFECTSKGRESSSVVVAVGGVRSSMNCDPGFVGVRGASLAGSIVPNLKSWKEGGELSNKKTTEN
eukprot:Blabericola_migrator_1__10382@NODE_585_length_7468_cov_222_283070_g432_i0_p7_GENE_NODE_585_length_7468_cov_222_283070_g432_i0NODE_585_length_7468_cov_222_283070_g432_i0_p7_ORF_typecomplete_len106_score11_12DAGAT/PF03982_13/0_074_NODE_585_length_7468_cov_222_283070_g432_i051325449